MNFKEIEYDSLEYKKSIILRDKVLREPLGLYFTDEYLEQDRGQIILGTFEGRNLLAVLHLKIVNTSTIQMRQVAVHNDMKGQGLGTALVKYAEGIAKDRDFKRIELNARDTSIPFYEKLKYFCVGDVFEEIGIPHRKMYKNLQ